MATSQRRAVIIGAGLSGLAASRDLLAHGWQVTICDSAGQIGGLASSFDLGGFPVERYYHFICGPDSDLLNLADELGIKDQIHWIPTRTGYFYDGKLYPFSSPMELLRFQPVPLFQRLRFGLHVLACRFQTDWRKLDDISAETWLSDGIGRQAYRVIWEPLLKVKFGESAGKISAAWIWNRIWRVARSRKALLAPEEMGYFERGSLSLNEALFKDLSNRPGFQLKLNTPIRSIRHSDGKVQGVALDDGFLPVDIVLSTTPLPVLNSLLSNPENDYFQRSRQVDYIGLVCVLLQLDRAFSKAFWTNVHDPRVCFNGIIEYTNLNRHYQKAGINLMYIPYYLPVKNERFSKPDDDIIKEYIQALKMINPSFDRSWVMDWRIFREQYAQAVCTTGFVNLMPDRRTPVKGLYVTDSTQFYPEDRTLSAAIRCGRRAAELMISDMIEV